MKIHDKLWYVIHKNSQENLAYMTQVDENKSSFLSKVKTGCQWAGYQCDVDSGVTIDNKPISGFYIGSSVSRWSTSNKLFRVKDPRGFTVEVPTDNIATLLHITTVQNGVVQKECVWGRDGVNHILLPVNSEPYLEAKKTIVSSKDYISTKNLKPGDHCSIMYQGRLEKVVFIGKSEDVLGYAHHHHITHNLDNPWYYKFGEIFETHEVELIPSKWIFNRTGTMIVVAKPKLVSIEKNDPSPISIDLSWFSSGTIVKNYQQHLRYNTLPPMEVSSQYSPNYYVYMSESKRVITSFSIKQKP